MLILSSIIIPKFRLMESNYQRLTVAHWFRFMFPLIQSQRLSGVLTGWLVFFLGGATRWLARLYSWGKCLPKTMNLRGTLCLDKAIWRNIAMLAIQTVPIHYQNWITMLPERHVLFSWQLEYKALHHSCCVRFRYPVHDHEAIWCQNAPMHIAKNMEELMPLMEHAQGNVDLHSLNYGCPTLEETTW